MIETLHSRLVSVARRQPEQAAVLDGGTATSYRELVTTVDAIAESLVLSGIEPGDRVALLMPNESAFAASFFAVARLCSVVVPLSVALKTPEAGAILKDAAVSAVLTVEEFHGPATRAVEAAGLSGVPVLIVRAEGMGPTRADGRVSTNLRLPMPDSPFLVLYSSGSTGHPKRVERSQKKLLFETDRLIDALALTADDRVLGVAPFSHVNGLMRSMVASLLGGSTLVVQSEFERRRTAGLIEAHRVTVYVGVPFMFTMLAETRWPTRIDLSSLRLCLSASAPLRANVSRRFYERYGTFVRQLYGTTETGSISANLEASPEHLLESVGQPLAGITVEVFSEQRERLPAGSVGELGIISPAAASEYAGRLQETARAFHDGFFFPGDIGRKDTEGRVYLLGRKSLFINRGGFKVNPQEIEEVLEQHPRVREAAVTGLETADGDQRIRAIVVTDGVCEANELVDFCRERLADFKVPSLIEFRDLLPRTSLGKLLRTRL